MGKNIPILDNAVPKHIAQMQQFLDFATANPPCYVHCEAGKGRTGLAVAWQRNSGSVSRTRSHLCKNSQLRSKPAR